MRVPLISIAQVHILAEGVVEAAPFADAAAGRPRPATPFTVDVIRAGLPEPGGFGCDDLRWAVMTRIHLETRIEAPIERVFDLARDIDLHARSMAAHRRGGDRRSDVRPDRTRRDRHVARPPLRPLVDADESDHRRRAADPLRRRAGERPVRAVRAQAHLRIDGGRHAHDRRLGAHVAARAARVAGGPARPRRHMRRLLETRNAALKAAAEAEDPRPLRDRERHPRAERRRDRDEQRQSLSRSRPRRTRSPASRTASRTCRRSPGRRTRSGTPR